MYEEVLLESASQESLVGQVADEFLERQQRGERPTAEEYASRHPEAAELLRRVLTALEIVDLSAAGRNGKEATVEPPAVGILGDFRIIREVGRGGMGVVYEAEQISLGRRVALKVLPFAATLDARHLIRFQNEARAAASLDHAHIVKVHAVGCERGVHFFAMQFIEGQSLETLIQSLRQENQPASPSPPSPSAKNPPADAAIVLQVRDPDKGMTVALVEPDTVKQVRAVGSTQQSLGKGRDYFRRVAEIGIQAAEALEHAHQLGVIHRDIKPGNLMLDSIGNLWVTDFGLAQIQSEAKVTMSGDLVGTLRYMSPEQALAKRVVVDHRSDVYSLGATLYEIVTLHAAFRGNDRQELLRQIAVEEPTAPRKLSRAIPIEMETVILKAMEKNPQDRYGAAKELADDLKRFLNDEPTLARRPSVIQRVRKWSRRHVAAVRATAAALLAVVIMAAGLAGWWLNDRANRQAETARSVDAALEESYKWQRESKTPEALAAAQRAAATLASGAATLVLEKRVQERVADLKLVADLEEVRLKRPGMDNGDSNDGLNMSKAYAQVFREFDIDVEFLGTAAAVERIKARTVAIELAAALDHWALVVNPSSKSFDKELRNRLLVVAKESDPDPLRRKLRDALTEENVVVLLSLALQEELPAPTALALVGALSYANRETEALDLLRKVQKREPDYFWINYALGERLFVMRTPQINESIRYLTLAVALRRASAAAHNRLGIALRANGRLHEALAEYREAIRLQPDYYMAHNNLGALLCDDMRDYGAAITAFEEAIRLKSDHPTPYTNLSAALRNKGELKEALAAGEKALHIDPNNAASHTALGNVFSAMGQLDKAIAAYKQSTVLNPDHPEAFFLLGKAFGDTRQWDDAATAFQKALKLKPEYAQAHNNLGNVFKEMGRLEDALNCYRTAIHHNPKLWQPFTNLASHSLKKGLVDQAIGELEIGLCVSSDLWHLHTRLGIIFLEEKKRTDDAIKHFNKAIELKSDFAIAHYCLGNAHSEKKEWDAAIDSHRFAIKYQPDYAEAHNNLGNLLHRKGRIEDAITSFKDAIRFNQSLWNAHNNLGYLLRDKGLLEDAITAFQKAVKLKPDLAQTHLELGNLLMKRSRWDDAIAAFQNAINANRDLAYAHNGLGMALSEKGQYEQSFEAFRNAIRLQPARSGFELNLSFAYNRFGEQQFQKGLKEQAVDSFKNSIVANSKDPAARWNLSIVLQELGRLEEARVVFENALEQLDPSTRGFVEFHNGLAWLLATAADQKVRDPMEALAHAQKAVKLMPQKGEFWNSLGVARYRNGDWQGANEAIGKSIELCKHIDASDCFVLAMSHWQLGDNDQARIWYDVGVRWLETNQPNNTDFQRLRAEAAELLRIELPAEGNKVVTGIRVMYSRERIAL